MALNDSSRQMDFDKILNNLPIIQDLIPYVATTILVDSNVLIGDLRWMLLKEQLTTLLKLAESRRIVIFFPEESIHEIEEHFPKLAKESRVQIDKVREKWNHTYKRLIRLVPDLKPRVSAPMENDLRDLNDLPFLRLFSFLYPEFFLTQDKDLLSLGIGDKNYVQISIDLRGYHVGESILYTFSACGAIITLTGVPLVNAFYNAIKSLYLAIKSLPDAIKLISLVVIIAVLIWPKSHKLIKDLCLNELPSRFNNFRNGLVPVLLPIFEYLETGMNLKQKGMEKLRDHQTSLTVTAPKMVKDYIFVVLSKTSVPLSVDQIAQMVKIQGYRTTNVNFTKYVQRILRSEPIFSKVDSNRWILGLLCGSA